jgi:hypothetical protein
MKSEDDNDIKPRPELWDKAIIALAALLTLAALGAAYYLIEIPVPKRLVAPQADPISEVSVGIAPTKPATGH